jgi:hypothetical protein
MYGRSRSKDQFIPGWPYSFVAALEPGRTSWTQVLDAVRLGPDDDVAEVTAGQVRAVLQRLIAAGQWRSGDADVLVVFDSGYDLARLAFLLADLPVEVLGRLRRVDLASAYAESGEPELACNVLADAYEHLASIGNRRGLNRAHRARERLDRWKTQQPVRELDQKLMRAAQAT